MIILTKLDGQPFLVNSDNIKHIEKSGDTIIHYINGDTVIVKESLDEVEEKFVNLQRKVFGSK